MAMRSQLEIAEAARCNHGGEAGSQALLFAHQTHQAICIPPVLQRSAEHPGLAPAVRCLQAQRQLQQQLEAHAKYIRTLLW